MPEGDTIHRTATTLRSALLGRDLRRVEVARHPRPHPAVGATVIGVEARGKHLLVHSDDGLTVHTHQRMTGSWHLYRHGERWQRPPRAARVVLGVADIVAVCFASPVVEVLRTARLDRHPALRRLGPDLCDPTADLAMANGRLHHLSAPERSVGDALLDQRIACGVGNVYRCEVLFLAGLDPWTPIERLERATTRALLSSAASLLRANLGATARSTVPAGPPGRHWVHGRGGQACRRCGTTVRTSPLGPQGRIVFWCPSCQPRARQPGVL